jgi:hypothetical protein
LDYQRWFTYTVGVGQNVIPLDAASTLALAQGLNNPVTDSYGLTADLTLPAPGTTGSLGFNKSINISAWVADYRFVNRLYEDFLHRSAYADSTSSYWVNYLESLEQQWYALATARSIVTSGITSTTEARNDVVNQMYLAFLKRSADPAGLSYWEGQLANGATEEQVMAGLLSSGEFQQDAYNWDQSGIWGPPPATGISTTSSGCTRLYSNALPARRRSVAGLTFWRLWVTRLRVTRRSPPTSSPAPSSGPTP